uniref:Protein-tyrosine sulfotransferase n=1 Tax=Panagrolaimus sp. PS1159 TaxID=55785 RepID=A0AC35G249_9BILA
MRWGGGIRCLKKVLPFGIFTLFCLILIFLKFPKCKEWQPSLMHRPVLFIGGVPRSGTTLMRAMLDAHPDVRCGEETRVIPNILSMLMQWEKEGHKRLLDLAGVTRNVLNNAVGAFIGIVIEQHGDKAELLCDKDPLALKMMIRLSEIFPKAKFILMLRDGRASVHSMIVRKVPVTGFDRTNKEQMLSQWNKTIAQMYNSCEFLGPEICLPVYYEKLILSPKEQMQKIINFLEIDFSQNVLEHHKHIGDEIRLSPREFSTSQVKNKINQDALDAWVGFFPDELLAKLDEVAPMLTKLGYDTKRYKPNYENLPIL